MGGLTAKMLVILRLFASPLHFHTLRFAWVTYLARVFLSFISSSFVVFETPNGLDREDERIKNA